MNKFNYLSIIFVLVLFILGAYFFGFNKSEYKNAVVKIKDKEFKVLIASDPIKRSKGLGGFKELKDNEGMLFLFNQPDKYGFWMKDMLFPIDIIWIKDFKIVDIASNVLPEGAKNILELKVYYPKDKADKVLEINAGLAEKYGFKIGDEVLVDIK